MGLFHLNSRNSALLVPYNSFLSQFSKDWESWFFFQSIQELILFSCFCFLVIMLLFLSFVPLLQFTLFFLLFPPLVVIVYKFCLCNKEHTSVLLEYNLLNSVTNFHLTQCYLLSFNDLSSSSSSRSTSGGEYRN